MSELDINIGKKIKELREARGMTQIELAEKTGLSFQQIGKYEKGQTRFFIDRLADIAMALGASINTFFDENTTIFYAASPEIEYTDNNQQLSETTKKIEEDNGYKPFFLTPPEIALIKQLRKINNKKITESILQHLKGIIEIERSK